MLILQALVNGVLTGGLYAVFSVGFSLIFGVMGVLNIAHGELLMLGAFATFWLARVFGLDPFLSLPISFGLMFVLGYLLQRLFIGRVAGQPHIMSYIMTFGLHLVLANLALVFFTADPQAITLSYGGGAMNLGGITVPYLQAITFLLSLVVIGGLSFVLARTRSGRAIRAVGQNRELALLMGINVRSVYALTFGLGAGITAVAGSLIATFRHIEPSMGLPYTIIAFCVVVLGGMGHLPGALWGGLILGVVGSLSSALLTSGWSMAITFFLLYLVLLLRPAGITGRGAAR